MPMGGRPSAAVIDGSFGCGTRHGPPAWHVLPRLVTKAVASSLAPLEGGWHASSGTGTPRRWTVDGQVEGADGRAVGQRG